MPSIAFIDTEVDPSSKKILDIGGISNDGNKFNSPSLNEFKEFIQPVEYLCGHNIIDHDKKYLDKWIGTDLNTKHKFIDTLFLSPYSIPNNHIISL